MGDDWKFAQCSAGKLERLRGSHGERDSAPSHQPQVIKKDDGTGLT